MRQDSTCGQVQAPGQSPSAPKLWKSDVHRVKKRDCRWRNLRRKENMQSMSLHWRAQRRQRHAKWTRGSKDFRHPAGFEPYTHCDSPSSLTCELVSIWRKKQYTYYTSRKIKPIVLAPGSSFRIAQVIYQGQTSYTRIQVLDLKSLINIYCSILQRLELKYFS